MNHEMLAFALFQLSSGEIWTAACQSFGAKPHARNFVSPCSSFLTRHNQDTSSLLSDATATHIHTHPHSTWHIHTLASHLEGLDCVKQKELHWLSHLLTTAQAVSIAHHEFLLELVGLWRGNNSSCTATHSYSCRVGSPEKGETGRGMYQGTDGSCPHC